MTHLLDDVVEEAAGVLGLDLLLDPPVGGEVRDVGLVDRAGSDGTSYYRLDKGNLDGGEASFGEDLLDDGGSGNGGVVEERGFTPMERMREQNGLASPASA